MTRKHVPYLMDEAPISVYPTLAARLGNINKAVMLQQVHYLLNVAKTADKQYNFVDDKWWVYNTYAEWQSHFPWLSQSAIKALFASLEDDGLILSRQGVKDKRDRRKWYTIDYETFAEFISCNGQEVSDATDKNYPFHETKSVRWNGQNLSDDIKESETTTETTTEIKELVSGETGSSEPVSEVFDFPEKQTETAKPSRPRDPMFDAIAEVWKTTAGGWIGSMRSMFLGTAKNNEWAKCNFDPPATAEEIRAFGKYMTDRRRAKKITEPITQPATIQRWFYDYRATLRRHSLEVPDAPPEPAEPIVMPSLEELRQRRENVVRASHERAKQEYAERVKKNDRL